MWESPGERETPVPRESGVKRVKKATRASQAHQAHTHSPIWFETY